jgi:hypothetical protein
MQSPVRRPTVWSIVKFSNGMIAYVYYVAPPARNPVSILCERSIMVVVRQCSQNNRRHVEDVLKRCLPIHRYFASTSSIVEQCPVKLHWNMRRDFPTSYELF